MAAVHNRQLTLVSVRLLVLASMTLRGGRVGEMWCRSIVLSLVFMSDVDVAAISKCQKILRMP